MADLAQRLIDHVTRGELLDLAAGESVDEAAMRSWGEDRTIEATVVRDILRGRLAPDPDPHGLQLRGARITGRLDAENLTTDVALSLFDCLLTEGMVARNAHLPYLVLDRCRLEHPDASPLAASSLTASRLSLEEATVVAATESAAVSLINARISGVVDCSGARLFNPDGRALDADGLQCGGGLYLRDGFEAVGDGELGLVRLVGADIELLDCTGAKLRNGSGPALMADGMRAAQGVRLRAGFEAVGTSDAGAVRLLQACIGELACTGGKIRNYTGPALAFHDLRVDGNALLRRGFEALGSGEFPTIQLPGVRISGTLDLDPARLEHPDPSHRLDVDGLEYGDLAESWQGWLDLLRDATPYYAPQPYQQLAAAQRAAGHDRDARAVLIAQRHDQLRRAATSRGERAWGRLTWITLGYGYQPWRALLGLLAIVLAAVFLAVLGPGAHGGLSRTVPKDATAVSCSTVDRIGVGLDFGLPLIKTGARSDCTTTDTAAGQALTATGWTLQACAWAFATLFVAGFTSAVRKT